MQEPTGTDILDATDADMISAILPDVTLTQLSPGRLVARRELAALGSVICYRERWSQKMLGRGAIPDGYFMFGTGASPALHVDYCGHRVDAHRIGCTAPNSELRFHSQDSSEHVVMFVHQDLLAMTGGIAAVEGPTLASGFTCRPEHGRRFISTINTVVDRCLADPSVLKDADTTHWLRRRLVGSLLSCLDNGVEHPAHAFPIGRQLVLRRALDRAESVEWRIGVPQLAASVGVAQRTLQCAFNEGLGVTPVRFLRLRRLKGAHRDLRDTSPGSGTVRSIATRWGFTELGRFAGEYRQLFGERPSETLRGERFRSRPEDLWLARGEGGEGENPGDRRWRLARQRIPSLTDPPSPGRRRTTCTQTTS